MGVLTLQDIAAVKVQAEVPEREMARVKVGSPVQITVDPHRVDVFHGIVERAVHNLDPRTRTMGVEADIPDPSGRLKPGMFARVEVKVDSRGHALTISAEALRLGEARPSVMAVRSGTIVQGKELVRPGQRSAPSRPPGSSSPRGLTLLAMRNGIAILMASLAVVLLGAASLARMLIDLLSQHGSSGNRVGV